MNEPLKAALQAVFPGIEVADHLHDDFRWCANAFIADREPETLAHQMKSTWREGFPPKFMARRDYPEYSVLRVWA